MNPKETTSENCDTMAPPKEHLLWILMAIASVALVINTVFTPGFVVSVSLCLLGVASLTGTGWIAYRQKTYIDELKHSIRLHREQIIRSDRQLSELRLQFQLLQRQKRNTEAIIYSIRDAVIVTDSSDRLLLANQPAANLFDFGLDNTTLKPIEESIKNTEFIELVANSRKSKTPHVKGELVFDTAGCVKTYNCIISCIHDETANICGVVSVLHDITKEKEVSQMKNDFVSHVSHELKTPLASIMAYSEMLVDGEADDEQTREEFYTVIQTQAKRLERLIEDILNISRIESGLIKVKKEHLSTEILIRQAVQMIKGYAAEKNITINEQSQILYGQVHADNDMISQVIINLLSNAVKYTPEAGSINIDCHVDEARQVVIVTVTDTGVGIPAEDVDHVFDKFYRVEANKKCAKGTGLGLNLVKQIIEKVHDGHVFVSSEQNKGSTFGFELPLAAGNTVAV